MTKTLIAALATLALAGAAHASADFNVNAKTDSVQGSSGLNTGILLTSGEAFSVTVNPDELWNAGTSLEWSNANGLDGTIRATGSDASGKLAGTIIGEVATHRQFYIGELVGQIGNGAYFAIGTDYSGTASTSGVLKLFQWDSWAADNSGTITAAVSTVPEPASVALMLAGAGMIAGMARRRSKNAA